MEPKNEALSQATLALEQASARWNQLDDELKAARIHVKEARLKLGELEAADSVDAQGLLKVENQRRLVAKLDRDVANLESAAAAASAEQDSAKQELGNKTLADVLRRIPLADAELGSMLEEFDAVAIAKAEELLGLVVRASKLSSQGRRVVPHTWFGRPDPSLEKLAVALVAFKKSRKAVWAAEMQEEKLRNAPPQPLPTSNRLHIQTAVGLNRKQQAKVDQILKDVGVGDV